MSGFFMVLVVLSKTNISFFGIFKIFTTSKKQKEALSHIFKVNRKLCFFLEGEAVSLSPYYGRGFFCLFVLPFSDCLWTEQLHLDSPPK